MSIYSGSSDLFAFNYYVSVLTKQAEHEETGNAPISLSSQKKDTDTDSFWDEKWYKYVLPFI